MTLGDLLNDVHHFGTRIARRCWDEGVYVRAHHSTIYGQCMVMHVPLDGGFLQPWCPGQMDIFAQDWALYDGTTKRAVPAPPPPERPT